MALVYKMLIDLEKRVDTKTEKVKGGALDADVKAKMAALVSSAKAASK
mgnify:CR=1 FL=1